MGRVGVSNYQYRDADLGVIWNTCVPRDDQAALDYIDFVNETFKTTVEFVECRVRGEGTAWRGIKWEEYNDDTARWDLFQPRLLGALAQG